MSNTRQNLPYDHPSFRILRTAGRSLQIAATGVQVGASFRSKLKAIVTGIFAIVNSAATGTIILTLLFNGSVAAVLTLGNTANQNNAGFTLTSNRTLNDMTDKFDISVVTHATGKIYVEYQFHIVPQDVVDFGTNLI